MNSFVHTAMASLPSRVFMNGHSQAVRIPAEFRWATDRVQISRRPEDDLPIHSCPRQRGGRSACNLGGIRQHVRGRPRSEPCFGLANAGSRKSVIYLFDTNILIDLIKKKPPKWQITLMRCQKRISSRCRL